MKGRRGSLASLFAQQRRQGRRAPGSVEAGPAGPARPTSVINAVQSATLPAIPRRRPAGTAPNSPLPASAGMRARAGFGRAIGVVSSPISRKQNDVSLSSEKRPPCKAIGRAYRAPGRTLQRC